MSSTKRRRSSEEQDGDSQSKRRGRPRLEKQDESAIDRRRTQIRVAQRAYRQRQEGALDELRGRVSELTVTVQKMYDEFQKCFVHAMSSTNPDEVSRDVLRNAAKQFEMLLCTVRETDQSLPITPPPELNERANVEANDGHRYKPRPANVSSWIDRLELGQEARRIEKAQAGMGYSLIEPAVDETPNVVEEAVEIGENSASSKVDMSMTRSVISHDTFTLFPSLPPAKLKPQTTYSFHETTIARRLHRACLEAGYRILLEPEHRPEIYERVFGFALASRHRDELTALMRSLLARDTTEPLEIIDAPTALLGGAGTHYPRKRHFGLLDSSMLSQNLGQNGAYTYSILERETQSLRPTTDLRRFEGEWLDPYDVQGYLEEKGIFIDPTSSFAEAEIPTASSSSIATPSSHSTTILSLDVADMQMSEPATLFVNSPALQKMANSRYAAYDTRQAATAMGFSNGSNGSWTHGSWTSDSLLHQGALSTSLMHYGDMPWQMSNAPTPSSDQQKSQSEMSPTRLYSAPSSIGQQEKRPVLIDVTKFVQTLVTSAVCLGRTPGYRRHDVDRAIQASLFDAF